MSEAPALEVIFEIDQLFGQLVEIPMRLGVAIDLGPGRLNLARHLPRRSVIASQHLGRDGEAAPRQQRHRLGIDTAAVHLGT